MPLSILDLLEGGNFRDDLRIPGDYRTKLLDRVKHAKRPCKDEEVWTLLLASAYCYRDSNPVAEDEMAGAAPKLDGPSALAGALTGESISSRAIWLECCPFPPRKAEGNTNLDLALGDVKERRFTSEEESISRKTEGGEVIRPLSVSAIELSKPGGTIAFCEFKWLSDIATGVTHSAKRNQLARVAENAMMFRSGSASPAQDRASSDEARFPDAAYVVLVTPRVFRDRPRSRLYGYKWQEYDANRGALLADLADCGLDLRPDMPESQARIDSVHFRWRSYEELMYQAPPSRFREALLEFYELHAGKAILSAATD